MKLVTVNTCRIAHAGVLTAALLLFAAGGKAQAQTTLIDDDFESGTLESWTASGSDAGLYQNGDVVSNMGAGDELIDYAPNGDYSLWDGRGGNDLQLTNPLTLDTQGYTTVTISFNYNFRNGSGTRRLRTYYADDGSTWQELGFVTGSGYKTYPLNEGVGAGEYTFTDSAKFRFAFGDSGGAAGPAFVDDIVITGGGAPTPDTDPPTPDPMTFAVEPVALNASTITMTATAASDETGPVEYYFENTTNSDFRDWSIDPTWTNTGLSNGMTYGYQVKARDAVMPTPNETDWSTELFAVAQPDATPPTPDPMSFAVAPKSVDSSTITMTATTASDLNGPVEYYFENTSNSDFRDWSTDPTWTNTGLTTGQTYDYQVKARDAAAIPNETDWSETASATPLAISTLVDDDFESGTLESWTASGSDAGLYQNGDVVSNMGAGDELIDYAPTGDYSLWDGRGGDDLQLTNALSLDTQGFATVTISFNYNFRNGSGTRRLRTYYADDGSTWQELGFVTGSGSKTYTLNEGDFTFTDSAKFRFAFGDSGGAAGPAFIDDIVITGIGGGASGSVPDIIALTRDGSGNVILTLDGSAAGLTAQQSDDLTPGSFADVTSTPSGNTLTIAAGDVDPDADGKDHYRVRN